MKKYSLLFWYFRKLQLMRLMEFRVDFLFWTVVSVLWTFFNFFFFALVFGDAHLVAGWKKDELTILLSIFTMIDALTWSVYYPNMAAYTSAIFDGSLSRYLLLPVSTLFLVTTQHTNFHNIPRFFIGLAILIHTLFKLQYVPTASQLVLATIYFCISSIFLYCGWFLLATGAFWVEKLDNITEIMPGLRRVYQVPRQVYQGIGSSAITLAFPLVLVTSLPSEALLGKPVGYLPWYFASFTLLFVISSFSFYRYSVKKYTSVGG